MKRLAAVCGVFGLLMVSASMSATGQDPASPDPDQIVRVEEDWVVFISDPDADTGAPQIVGFLSPDGTTQSEFALFEVNHGSHPDFYAGGVQVQAWLGSTMMMLRNSTQDQQLHFHKDKVEFTTAMEIKDGQLVFEMRDGRSKTWGNFANEGELRVAVPTTRTNLASYNPDKSVANTAISLGAHRVPLMYQSVVRYITADGESTQVTRDVELHRYKDLVQYVSIEEYQANPEYYNVEAPEE